MISTPDLLVGALPDFLEYALISEGILEIHKTVPYQAFGCKKRGCSVDHHAASTRDVSSAGC